MKKGLFIIAALFIGFSSFAQKDRYRFAATYFGIEGEYIQENNSFYYLNNSGNIDKKRLPSSISPRFLIGGTHFWGHADFYISIPIANIKLNNNSNASISNDVLTGFRLLPIRLKSNAFSPYIGIGFNSKEYSQKGANGKGPIYTNWQWYQEIGLAYQAKKSAIIELGIRYFSANAYNSYIDRSTFKKTEVSPFSFSFSYKKVFDFTAGYSSENAKKYMAKVHKKAEKEGALSAFSLGVGFSALIPLKKTELASRHSFFNDEIEGNLFPDLGIAYYSSPLDASARLSFRPLKQKESAFDYTYELRRNSFAFEIFKFLGDYHGFVPFIGPYVSIDQYQLIETDHGEKIIDNIDTKLGYGVVFGWDIRQTKADYLVLRTNLRYTPEFSYKKGKYRFTTEQIEFNFIQLVFYPERYKVYKNLTQ